jgi:DNA-binding MarR family transcriptional regulator
MTKPDAGEAAFALLNEIGIIAHLSQTELERVLPDGLSVAGFGVLNHFVRLQRETEAPAQLARNFQVTKGAMTFTLQKLEAAGFVRIAPDPKDGRAKLVSITPAGRRARERAIQLVTPMLAAMSKELSGHDIASAVPLLRALRVYLDARRDEWS